ncbi:MAG: hypothetical protein ACLT98_02940 [Eggerthellaceae bacterium]
MTVRFHSFAMKAMLALAGRVADERTREVAHKALGIIVVDDVANLSPRSLRCGVA